MAKKYGIQLRGLGKALKPRGPGVLRPKPTDRYGQTLKPKPIRPGKKDGGMPDRLPRETAQPIRPRDKRKAVEPKDEGSRGKLKPVRPGQKGLRKLPKPVRNKMGYMKDGGRAKKFPDLTGDGKVTRADVLKGRGVFGAGGGVRGSTKSADIYSRIKQRHRLKQIRQNFKKGKK